MGDKTSIRAKVSQVICKILHSQELTLITKSVRLGRFGYFSISVLLRFYRDETLNGVSNLDGKDSVNTKVGLYQNERSV